MPSRPTEIPARRARGCRAGACDTHAHICGPADVFPYAERAHLHAAGFDADDYLHLLDVLGIDRAVLVQPSVYGTDNRALLDALSRRRGRGCAASPSSTPDISADEIRTLDDAGIRGVRFNLVDHKGERNVVPDDVVRALAERDRAVRLAHRIPGQSRRGAAICAADRRTAGRRRGRASRLSAQQRRPLVEAAEPRRLPAAVRNRPLLGQADRALSHLGGARLALSPMSRRSPIVWPASIRTG